MTRQIGTTWLTLVVCCVLGAGCASAPAAPVAQSTAPTATGEVVLTVTVSDATPSATVAAVAATPSDTVVAAPSPSQTAAIPSATASPASLSTSLPTATAGLESTATSAPAPTTRPISAATTAPRATSTSVPTLPQASATAVPTMTTAPASPTPAPTMTTAPPSPTPARVLSAKPTGGGTLAGVVTDTAGRPISGAFVTVGFKSFKLVGQSDASGHYAVTGIPNTPGVEVFSFAPGYVYDHSGGFPIPSGRVTGFNIKLAADPSPALDPVFSSPGVSAGSVARGGSATLSVTVQSSQVMSDEVIAASGQLGRSALFVPVGGGRYQATFVVPTDIPAGVYSFSLFGATDQCEVNARFPTVQLAVT